LATAPGDSVNAQTSTGDIITLGDGANDSVNASPTLLNVGSDRITLGNGNNDSVAFGGGVVTLGNGNHDSVGGSASDSSIHLGNGAGDTVSADNSGSDTITLGNGAGDTVSIFQSLGDNTISLGNGASDSVTAQYSDGDIIALGDGHDDYVRVNLGNNDTITLGNGAERSVLSQCPRNVCFAFAGSTGRRNTLSQMERWSVFSDFRREPIVGVLTSPSKQVVRQLNERPHKALGIETPAERFNASVASTG
jgi:hypothetical protein